MLRPQGSANRIGWFCLLAPLLAISPVRSEQEDQTARRAMEIAAPHLQRLSEGYSVRHDEDRRIIYISALDDEHFARTSQLLGSFSDALRRTLEISLPQWTITNVLPTAEDYQLLAPEPKITGF